MLLLFLPRWAGIGLLVCVGCYLTPPAPPSAEALRQDALKTHAAYVHALNTGAATRGPVIPQAYWKGSIRALNPVKVYSHRANIVVVQRVHNGVEEGKYITLMISSYLPQNGVDGFTYTPNPQQGGVHNTGNGVFDFKRVP